MFQESTNKNSTNQRQLGDLTEATTVQKEWNDSILVFWLAPVPICQIRLNHDGEMQTLSFAGND